MGKIAFLCAGQGAQKIGMGESLYQQNDAAKQVLDDASAAVDFDMKDILFNGPKETLNNTLYTQPCLAAVDMMAAQAVMQLGVQPDAVAGFSLGEYPALALCGALSAPDMLALLCTRAQHMAQAADEHPGGMAAVLGLGAEAVEELCKEAGESQVLLPVNYNCPGQIVIAGEEDALKRALTLLKERKVRAMKLKVSGAFHTPLMAQAAEQVAQALGKLDVSAPRIPIYLNTTGQASTDATELLAQVGRQTCSPVLFESTLRNMQADGFDTFIELGPGKTLSGLVQKTLDGVNIYNVETAEDLDTLKDGLKHGN